MTTFVLIPGAGGNGSYWRWLVPELQARGHGAIAVDIPGDDPALGLPEYAAHVIAAIEDRRAVEPGEVLPGDVVLVAQSLGGFTAPMVADRVPVSMIVFVNAMIPVPGETPGDWWEATGAVGARHAGEDAAGRSHDFDPEWHFLNGIDDEVRAELYRDRPREPADTPFGQPCDFQRWPDVALRAVVARDDRFFPADFQVRVARDRLAVPADLIDGGHLVAAGNPSALADLLVGYLPSG